MKIPAQIKIGGHIYQVVYPYVFKERFDRAGSTDGDACRILISNKCDGLEMPQSRIEEIFIHEVLHAVDSIYNGGKLEEEDVKRLAEGLYQVLSDNNLLKK